MGKPEETKRLDKTNYDVENWMQDGYLNTAGENYTLEAKDVSNAISIL